MTDTSDAKSTKPNCYECKHRRDLPGNAHSSCGHPKVAPIMANAGVRVFAVLGGGGMLPPIGMELLGVKGHPQGIKRGWFSWPANFDPVWLLACDGFEAHAKAEEPAP